MAGQSEGYIIRKNEPLADISEESSVDDAEMLRRAEEAVESLKAEYPEWVGHHLAALEDACRTIRAEPEASVPQLAAIADLSHDVKGEGTTYGYPLMTQLGASLHRFVTNMKACSTVQIEIIENHVSAMRVVIRERIEGDGGALGHEIVGSLEKAVAKFKA